MTSSPRSATNRSTYARASSSATAASSKTSTKTSSSARNSTKPNFQVVYRFEDGTQEALPLEEQVFLVLSLYAQMFTSEDPLQREAASEKLREVARIVAQAEGASVIGKMLKEKQLETFNGKNDKYMRFLDGHPSSTNTKQLARLLQERFGINSFRSCEDAVRAWKKNLRSAGGT